MGYTSGMKTAVSIPDPLFADVERLVKRLKVSRSKLFSRALAEFVTRHSPDDITAAMNRVVGKIDVDEDRAFRQAAARRVFERVEW